MSLGQALPGTPIKRKALLSNEVKPMYENLSQLSIPMSALHAAINNITTSRERVERNLTGRSVWVFNGHYLLSVDKLHFLLLYSRRSVSLLAQIKVASIFVSIFLGKFWVIMIIIMSRQIYRQIDRQVSIHAYYSICVLM